MRVVVQAWELLLRYQNGIMAAAFICSIALVAFGAGALASQYRVYPYHLLRQVGISARAIHKEVTGNTIEAREMRVSEFSTTEAAANRIGDARALSSGLLWHGGNGLFREICLERGCLAVEFSDLGEVVHAYPYRLDELQDWPKIVQLPRKVALPFETPRPATTVNSARKYPQWRHPRDYQVLQLRPGRWHSGQNRQRWQADVGEGRLQPSLDGHISGARW